MAFQGDSIFWVEVEKVVPNPFQPRREFDEEKLKELSESIKMYGVLQPLTVTRKEVHNDDGSFMTQYELIAGERRLRASRLAGVAQVPVIIRSGEQTEQEKLELAIIENLQREDLNAVDRALAFKQLSEAFKLSHAQVARKVGRSREYVSNSIRLLALPSHMLDGLRRGDISEGHARTLLMLKDKPEEQEVVYREILLKKLSVREVERISRKIANDKVRKREYKDTDAHLIEIEKEFTDTLGTRVQILKTDFGGKLTIDYFSEDDLDHLLKIMRDQNAKINAAAAFAASEISAQASDVGETVIREMDELSESIAALERATGLEAVAPSVAQPTTAPETPTANDHVERIEERDDIDHISDTEADAQTAKHEPATEPASERAYEPETSEEEMVTSQSVAPGHQNYTFTEDQVVATAEAAPQAGPGEQSEYASEASVTGNDAPETPTEVSPDSEPDSESEPSEALVAPSESLHHDEEMPEDSVQNGEPAPVYPVPSGNDNSSLRARLEAELARLEAEDAARAQSQTPSVTETSTTELPQSLHPAAAEASKMEHDTKKEKDDDDDLYSIRNFSL